MVFDPFRSIGRLAPKPVQEMMEEQLRFAAIEVDSQVFIGASLIFCLSFGITTSVVVEKILRQEVFLSQLMGATLGFFAFAMFFFTMLLRSDNRAKAVEEFLPDGLRLLSANVRAGMNPDEALLTLARDEFGVLGIEIEKVAGEAYIGGATFSDALLVLKKRLSSRILHRTVNLLIEGTEAGGQIAPLLEVLSDDIREGIALRKDLQAGVMSYTLLILVGVMLGAPIMYILSIYFVDVTGTMLVTLNLGESLRELANSPAGGMLPSFMFTMGQGASVDVGILKRTAMVNLIIASFFSSVLVGVFRDGTRQAGLKYAPFTIIGSLLVFLLSDMVLSRVTAGFMR